jgi:hypothetical protein
VDRFTGQKAAASVWCLHWFFGDIGFLRISAIRVRGSVAIAVAPVYDSVAASGVVGLLHRIGRSNMLKKSIRSGLAVFALLAMFAFPVLFATASSDEEVASWVRDQVKALQPTPEDKRFDEIGWAKSIVQAEKLAHQHNRPVFLFTHNGSIGTGRC